MRFIKYVSIVCIALFMFSKNAYASNIDLTADSRVDVSSDFGEYMSAVDENIYYSMTVVDDRTLTQIYGEYNTPMFKMAKKTINPCMAFATTWGEAGAAYPGISMTTVMDFNPSTYIDTIDWIGLSSNLEQVNSLWYIVNCKDNYNTNEDGRAYRMPVSLLQIPRGGDRMLSAMDGLGVGPYQITSSDWDTWLLDNRVSPIYGFKDSLKKLGTAWASSDINPISDLTVYAAMSLGHQGGSLITYDFGNKLINLLNEEEVQEVFIKYGSDMCNDARSIEDVTLSDLDVVTYLESIEKELGVDFSTFTGGPGSTNKGDYVARHLLRYTFYKAYFTSGM